jgi:hypothetical protein
MSELPATPEFDGLMMALFEMPEPETSFASALREQFVTTGAARKDRNKIVARFFPVSPRLAWGAVIGLVLAILMLLGTAPSVATALKRLLRYIPNAGSVEQSTTLRMLAEPVQVQREDVTVTVEQLVAGGERTVVVYRHVEPAVDYEQYVPPSEYKDDRPALILPDGSRLEVRLGRRLPSDGNGILYALEFDPIPSDVMELTLSLTRLVGLPPGAGLEDWEIPLKLKPAPEGTGYPVIEVPETRSDQPSPGSGEFEQTARYGISVAIEKYAEMPDGYLLDGSLRWTDPDIPEYGVIPLATYLLDANGNDVLQEDGVSELMLASDSKRYPLAYKLTGKDFEWPLTLLVDAVEVRFPSSAEFRFDFDPNMDAEQIVDLNIDIPTDNSVIHVNSVRMFRNFDGTVGLEFALRADDPQVIGVTLIDKENMSGGGGGGGVPPIPDRDVFTSTIYYENGPPSSPVSVMVKDIALLVEGPWQVTWEPAANQ